jgi:hypothetical protein
MQMRVYGKINLSNWGFSKEKAKEFGKALSNCFNGNENFEQPYVLFGWGTKLLDIEICLPFNAKGDYVLAIDFAELVANSLLEEEPERALKTAKKLRELADLCDLKAEDGYVDERAMLELAQQEKQLAEDPFRPVSDPYWLTHNPGPGPDRPVVAKPKAKATDSC